VGGISSILGTVAILGFVLFIAGIALAIVASSQGRKAGGGVTLAVVGLIMGLLFSVLAQGIVIVEPTRVAVVINTLTGNQHADRYGGRTTARWHARHRPGGSAGGNRLPDHPAGIHHVRPCG